MANIALRVELTSPSAVGSITGLKLESTSKVANTSFKVGSDNYYTVLPTSTFEGSNGLVWAGDSGELVINDNSMLDNLQNSDGFVEDEENPDEFFWGLTDAVTGEYELTLKIEGSGISLVTIFGDSVNRQFPIEAYLDGSTTPIYSDDPQWVIQFPSTANSHTVKFTKWNRKDYNAAITLIRITSSYYDLTTFTGLNDVKVTLQRNTNPQELEYGVVPNSGTFEMTDTDGEVEDLLRDGILPISNLPVDYYVNGKRKSRHITTDSDYSTDRTASASMSNNISKWDNIQFKGRAYTGTQTTLYTMLLDILNSTIFDNKLTSAIFDSLLLGFAKYNLQKTYTTYDYVEPDTLRSTVNKVCVVAQLNCYEVEENDYPYNIRFAHAMPAEYNTVQILTIPERYQASQPTKDIILRNKYDGVEIQECQVKDVREIDTLVYSRTEEVRFFSVISREANQAKGDWASAIYNNNYAITAVYLIADYAYISSIQIPKSQNLNLSQITSVYSGPSESGNANIAYSIEGKKLTYNNATINVSIPRDPDNESVGTVTSYEKGTLSKEESLLGMEQDLPTLTLAVEKIDSRMTSSVSLIDLTNNKSVIVDSTSNPNYYIIRDLYILIGETRVSGDYSAIGSTLVSQIPGTVEVYEPAKISISIKGNKRTISFDDFKAKQSANFDKAQTIVRFDENQLMSNRMLVAANRTAAQSLDDAIHLYYGNGVRGNGKATAKVTVFCGDIYDTAGNMVREWAKGKTYELGDIVRVDKDNAGNTEWYYKNGDPYYWRITGLTHRYSGAPYIDLELQEVRLISP